MASSSMIALMLTALVASCASLVHSQTTINILHFNDVHARIEEADTNGVCPCPATTKAAGRCFGGFARMATQVAAERAGSYPVLLLDAGDELVGSIWDAVYKGSVTPYFLNALGVDAMTLGNHDFDFGPANVASFIANITFPMMGACNMDVTAEPLLNGKVKDYIVKTVGGVKVGIVSYITPDTAFISQPGKNIVFNPIVPAVTSCVQRLQAANLDVKIIIALGHAGYDVDQEVAKAVPGVSLIIGGHSHTFLANATVLLDLTNSRTQAPVGPYPTYAAGPNNRLVPVVQAYYASRYLGKSLATFDANGAVIALTGGPILLGMSNTSNPVATNATVSAIVDQWAGPIRSYANQVVGYFATPGDVLSYATRYYNDTTLGNIVDKALLWYIKTQTTIEQTYGPVNIAWMNAGGLRANLGTDGSSTAVITYNAVFTVLPFGNLLTVKSVTGEDLIWSIEKGISGAATSSTPTTGGFAVTYGLRFGYDWNLPIGSRVINVEVNNSSVWQTVDPCAKYNVAINDFTANGGDGHTRLAASPYVFSSGPPMDQVLSQYLTRFSPIKETLTTNIGSCNYNPTHPLCTANAASPLYRTCAAKPSPSPSPVPSPTPSPKLASPKPASPKAPRPPACPAGSKVASNTYTITHTSGAKTWGAARDGLRRAVATVYRYYDTRDLSVWSGPKGQRKKRGTKATTWKLVVTLPLGSGNLCKRYTQTMRFKLKAALKKAGAKGRL